METINLEKVIKFKNQIDTIESVIVKDELSYKVNEDKMSAKGTIFLNGSVKTIAGEEFFEDTIDVDIYTPFSKLNENENIEIKVKDYNYMIQNSNLILQIVLELNGICNKIEKEEIIDDNNVVDNLNQINEIVELEPVRQKDEVKEVHEEIKEDEKQITSAHTNNDEKFNEEKNNVTNHDDEKFNEEKNNVTNHDDKKYNEKIIKKEIENKEPINSSWANSLFNLTSNYTTFKVIHVGDKNKNS